MKFDFAHLTMSEKGLRYCYDNKDELNKIEIDASINSNRLFRIFVGMLSLLSIELMLIPSLDQILTFLFGHSRPLSSLFSS